MKLHLNMVINDETLGSLNFNRQFDIPDAKALSNAAQIWNIVSAQAASTIDELSKTPVIESPTSPAVG